LQPLPLTHGVLPSKIWGKGRFAYIAWIHSITGALRKNIVVMQDRQTIQKLTPLPDSFRLFALDCKGAIS